MQHIISFLPRALTSVEIVNAICATWNMPAMKPCQASSRTNLVEWAGCFGGSPRPYIPIDGTVSPFRHGPDWSADVLADDKSVVVDFTLHNSWGYPFSFRISYSPTREGEPFRRLKAWRISAAAPSKRNLWQKRPAYLTHQFASYGDDAMLMMFQDAPTIYRPVYDIAARLYLDHHYSLSGQLFLNGLDVLDPDRVNFQCSTMLGNQLRALGLPSFHDGV